MGELDADLPAVGGAQPVEDLREALHRAARQVARHVGTIQVLVAEAVVGGVELGKVVGAAAEGIGVGDAVSPRPVGVDHAQHPGVLVGELRVGGSRFRSLFASAATGARGAGAGIRCRFGRRD